MKNNIFFKENDNIFDIQKIDYSIIGNILYMISSESGNIFILTDSAFFYSIEKGKQNYIKQYYLEIYSFGDYKVQTEYKESQIWCDKFGTHVIIKYSNIIYYFNPFILGEKIKPLYLVYQSIYLQPYAIAFNDDFYDRYDTGLILFSDYNSRIYEFQIVLVDKSEIYIVTFYPIFSLKNEDFDY